jgi:hypothetical protein
MLSNKVTRSARLTKIRPETRSDRQPTRARAKVWESPMSGGCHHSVRSAAADLLTGKVFAGGSQSVQAGK